MYVSLHIFREYYVKSLGPDRISWLDTYRLERHESFYGLDPSELDKQEAKDAMDKTEKFFSSIKRHCWRDIVNTSQKIVVLNKTSPLRVVRTRRD